MKNVAALFAAFGVCAAEDFTGRLPEHVRISPRYAQSFQTPKREPPKAPVVVRQPGVSAAQTNRCAHIIVHRADAKIDLKMVVPSDDKTSSRFGMPVLGGMPVCPQDVR